MAAPPRLRVIHWKPAECAAAVAKLRASGYEIDDSAFDGPTAMKVLRASPPAAVLIDLSRLPSQGRDVALWLRKTKATRHVPVIFVEGDAEKLGKIRSLLPDATYTTWRSAKKAVARALANPVSQPVQPDSVMAGYSGTPLPRKLGIKPDIVVALSSPPPNFAETLGSLPAGAKLRTGLRGRYDLIIWFVRTAGDLTSGIENMARLTPPGGLWIAWPKKTSPLASDISETHVRRTGLDAGLVDYKICAIDTDWSALKFAVRR